MRKLLLFGIVLLACFVATSCNQAGEHPCALFEDPDTLLAESKEISESGRPFEAFDCLYAGVEKFSEFADVWVRIPAKFLSINHVNTIA